jgi:hypothetical protein
LTKRTLLAAFAIGSALLTAGSAQAREPEIQRVEAVGAFPIDPNRPSRVAPRDAAMRAAIFDAMRRVARGLLPADFVIPTQDGAARGDDDSAEEALEEFVGPAEAEAELIAWLDQVLGDDPFEFATRFRVLDDRGLRPALLSGVEGIENEYVVVVEVYVDTGRIEEVLRAAGVAFAPSGDGRRFQIELVVEGVNSFAGYEELRQALLNGPGVRSAQPVEFRRGRVVMAVEADREASAVLDDLLAGAPPELQLIPLESEDDSVTLLMNWVALEPELESDEAGEPARR